MKDNPTVLSRKSYRELIRALGNMRKEYEEDQKKGGRPAAFGMVIPLIIERIVRGNHERFYRDLPGQVMEYLADRGILVRWLGDYTFPSAQAFPTREEIVKRTKELLNESLAR